MYIYYTCVTYRFITFQVCLVIAMITYTVDQQVLDINYFKQIEQSSMEMRICDTTEYKPKGFKKEVWEEETEKK